MKLGEVARSAGTSTTAIKFWIREGLLPAGELRNRTTAVYGVQHLERIALIQMMRSELGATISEIKALTTLIDDAASGPIDVMRACQLIMSGPHLEDTEQRFTEQVQETIDRAGWPSIPSVAARALAAALATSARAGFVYDTDQLVKYAQALDPLADQDISAIRPDATLDVLAHNMLVASAAQNRLFAAMNQLAHTSVAVRRMAQPDRKPEVIENG